MLFRNVLDKPFDLLRFRKIALKRKRRQSFVLENSRGIVETLLVRADQNYCRARSEQTVGNRQSKSARCPCNDGDFAR